MQVFLKPQKSKTKNLIAYHLCLNIVNTVNTYSILSIHVNFMLLLQEDMCTKISESRMNQQLVLLYYCLLYLQKKSYSNIPRTALVLHANIPRKIILKQLPLGLANRAHSRTWNVIRAGRRSSLSITLNLSFIYTKKKSPFSKQTLCIYDSSSRMTICSEIIRPE